MIKLFVLSFMFLLTTLAETDLKTVLEKGQKFQYKIKTHQTVTQIIQGNTLEQEQGNGTEYELEVLSVDDSGFRIKCTYKAVAIKIKSKGANVDFDSNKSSDTVPREAKPIASLLKKSFTYTLTKENKVTDVKGMDVLIDGMIKETTSAFTGNMKEQIEKKFKEAYGNDAVAANLQQAFAFYPGKNVDVNDTWTSNTELKSLYSFKVSNDWTLKEVDSSIAKISLNSKVKPASTDVVINGMKLTHNISGTQSGNVTFDLENKILKESIVEQSLSGALKVNRLSIPINIKSKIEQTVKKLN